MASSRERDHQNRQTDAIETIADELQQIRVLLERRYAEPCQVEFTVPTTTAAEPEPATLSHGDVLEHLHFVPQREPEAPQQSTGARLNGDDLETFRDTTGVMQRLQQEVEHVFGNETQEAGGDDRTPRQD